MNFQDARNNMEQDTLITGRVESVGGKEFNRNGTPLQKVSINDGEQVAKATIYIGRGEPMPSSLAGTEQNFTLKAKDHKGTIYFSGFWNNPNPILQQTPKQYGNANKDYSKATKSYDKAEKSYDKAGKEKTRSVCLSYAKDMVVGGVLPIDAVYTEAQKMVDFIENEPEDKPKDEPGDEIICLFKE